MWPPPALVLQDCRRGHKGQITFRIAASGLKRQIRGSGVFPNRFTNYSKTVDRDQLVIEEHLGREESSETFTRLGFQKSKHDLFILETVEYEIVNYSAHRLQKRLGKDQKACRRSYGISNTPAARSNIRNLPLVRIRSSFYRRPKCPVRNE